ncbi:bifunctional 2-polyprenyl-6-hydroxyphenol methylase/3-demethylubiquinol 3-O-methyltransferase UbiG [Snodgrassella sp. M0351]|uniref:bifunctional 2-polyprenyl-6-hydroxyphenol methylase/3-demethylubiquinol 3-O-methyltransferase UbiG n=1 Tax=Snodgrassella sp. M0351 TaxID=2751012 RepID=UPI0018DB8948|nr:bifunctional 2-polyprenyl-6-hydroxyphenol methylase/3-demethylubiquinol 3-O-methyltransferase UbiG [Snodgrassella sp. M0351]MBI0165706.1 bifunctional 2-polyprenyl-6-hydroxyphenol methylase/3-demethylubiquinol 3-O-methyltransferase UbiG [Snodgrassella sp. M0351]
MNTPVEQQTSLPAAPANVDAGEIDKFSQLAHKWWDKESEFKPLHDINPLRLSFIDSYARLAGKDVLDVGCGGGILSEAMAKAGASSVTGIDLAKKSLKIAQLHAMQEHVGNVSYRMVSVEDLAAEMPAGFGAVTCMEMLEHVPDPGSVVHACAQLVQPGGVVCFSTINRNIKSYMQAIIAAEYILQLMPHGTHDHRKFITPAELARLCRQAGLEWLGSSGFTYNPLTRRYHLTDSLDVNYMIACRRPLD